MPAALRLTDPELTLETVMDTWPATVAVFMRHKMICVGCLVAPFHTIEDACTEYHLDQDRFIAELSEAITSAPDPDRSEPTGGRP